VGPYSYNPKHIINNNKLKRRTKKIMLHHASSMNKGQYQFGTLQKMAASSQEHKAEDNPTESSYSFLDFP
jgi:hypothetical protein